MKAKYYLFILSMCILLGYGIFYVWVHHLYDHQTLSAWHSLSHQNAPEILLTLHNKKDDVEIECRKVTQTRERITYTYNKHIRLSYIATFTGLGETCTECTIQKEINIAGLSLRIGDPEAIDFGVICE
ncbi:hypothetical protein [Akkermansia glycaniphila]|uniref:Uncharacterized protein n=1 Tax=Akkermansia glycaniphila TaxID=1679444 RepID=A0A1C7PD50_9BACT|nr:hypothetical protein [Akkermansia glycaniphila]OCA03493.1 hypothetical protein AC781_04345 [Akkermansia glycaniphila]SEH83470.1 Hypothetical protein PYTT_1094 [Akkermansia glycaniphila]